MKIQKDLFHPESASVEYHDQTSLLSPDQQAAVCSIKTGKNVLITGKAGTGKSFLVQHLASLLHNSIVVAPTGLAAANSAGQTIHKAFGIELGFAMHADLTLPSKLKQRLLRAAKSIIIDEISMVRADILDRIDWLLKKIMYSRKPFGGKQIIAVGDLLQLPPVVTEQEFGLFSGVAYKSPWFFAANSFCDFLICELETSFRQKDGYFLTLLNGIREGNFEFIEVLNRYCHKPITEAIKNKAVSLVGTNKEAMLINKYSLSQLASPLHEFKATFTLHSLPFDQLKFWQALIDKTTITKHFSWPALLFIKEGARVMCLSNGQGCVNGDMGVVVSVGAESIKILLDKYQTIIEIFKEATTIYDYIVNEDGEIYKQEAVTMQQFPLALAWAITIHKIQGQTLANVILENTSSFWSPGQLYVALSRVKELDNLTFRLPLQEEALITSSEALSFLKGFGIH